MALKSVTLQISITLKSNMSISTFEKIQDQQLWSHSWEMSPSGQCFGAEKEKKMCERLYCKDERYQIHHS